MNSPKQKDPFIYKDITNHLDDDSIKPSPLLNEYSAKEVLMKLLSVDSLKKLVPIMSLSL
jgi:hypothetical protein